MIVTDLLGRVVADLTGSVVRTGERTHEAEFASTELPAGRYIYRLESASGTISGGIQIVR